MGVPRTDYKNPSHGVMLELMSALSSLHMVPKEIPEEERDKAAIFMDDLFTYAKHAKEHIKAAMEIMRENKL